MGVQLRSVVGSSDEVSVGTQSATSLLDLYSWLGRCEIGAGGRRCNGFLGCGCSGAEIACAGDGTDCVISRNSDRNYNIFRSSKLEL